MLKLIVENLSFISFLVKYLVKDKSFERLISSEKIHALVKMQPFPDVWRIFAELASV